MHFLSVQRMRCKRRRSRRDPWLVVLRDEELDRVLCFHQNPTGEATKLNLEAETQTNIRTRILRKAMEMSPWKYHTIVTMEISHNRIVPFRLLCTNEAMSLRPSRSNSTYPGTSELQEQNGYGFST